MEIVVVTNPLWLGFARQAMIGIEGKGKNSMAGGACGVVPAASFVYLNLSEQTYQRGIR